MTFNGLINLKFLHFEGLATMDTLPSFQGLKNLKNTNSKFIKK